AAPKLAALFPSAAGDQSAPPQIGGESFQIVPGAAHIDRRTELVRQPVELSAVVVNPERHARAEFIDIKKPSHTPVLLQLWRTAQKAFGVRLRRAGPSAPESPSASRSASEERWIPWARARRPARQPGCSAARARKARRSACGPRP